MIEIRLTDDKAYKWYKRGVINAKGYIFAGEKLYKEEQIMDYFQDCKDYDSLRKLVSNANGRFAVIAEFDEPVLATDIVLGIRLFYSFTDSGLLVSDDIYAILDDDSKIDKKAEENFIMCGYVLGEATLFKNIKQIEAGSLLQFKGREVISDYYYRSYTTKDSPKLDNNKFAETNLSIKNTINYTSSKSNLNNVYDGLLGRIKSICEEKQVVLPLTAGYDSRLLAVMLKEIGAEPICVNYGRQNNNEVSKSMRVAKELGFKHLFIDNIKETKLRYSENEDFFSYARYLTQFSSCYFYQEFPTIQYFLRNNIVDPKNTIVLPGHSGDSIAGRFIVPILKNLKSRKEIAHLLFDFNYRNIIYNKKMRTDSLSNIVDELKKYPPAKSYQLFEEWTLRERTAKYIANSAKIWEFYGFTVYLPFWDSILANFFFSLPLEMRYGKVLYEDFCFERFKKHGVLFDDDKCFLECFSTKYKLRELARHHLWYSPKKWRDVFCDNIGFEQLMRHLKEELVSEHTPISYNGLSFLWYISNFQDKNSWLYDNKNLKIYKPYEV